MSSFSSPFLAFLLSVSYPCQVPVCLSVTTVTIELSFTRHSSETHAVPCVEVQSFLAFRWFVPCVCVNLQGPPPKKKYIPRTRQWIGHQNCSTVSGHTGWVWRSWRGKKKQLLITRFPQRKEKCLKRTLTFLGGGGGQLFAYFLFSPGVLGT